MCICKLIDSEITCPQLRLVQAPNKENNHTVLPMQPLQPAPTASSLSSMLLIRTTRPMRPEISANCTWQRHGGCHRLSIAGFWTTATTQCPCWVWKDAYQ